MKYDICKHCKEQIHKSHGSWRHTIGDNVWCMVTIATPKHEKEDK